MKRSFSHGGGGRSPLAPKWSMPLTFRSMAVVQRSAKRPPQTTEELAVQRLGGARGTPFLFIGGPMPSMASDDGVPSLNICGAHKR